MADVHATQAAVAGKSWKKTVSATRVKGQRWPYYYGIQPAGRYPDQPFIRELNYDGATTGLLINRAKQVPVVTAQPPVIPPRPLIGIDGPCITNRC